MKYANYQHADVAMLLALLINHEKQSGTIWVISILYNPSVYHENHSLFKANIATKL